MARRKGIASYAALGLVAGALACGPKVVLFADAGTDAGAEMGPPPGCHYVVTPSALNFDQVKPGAPYDATVSIASVGADDCVVTDLALLAGSDNAFYLPGGAVASQTIASGTSFEVTVAFTPQQDGDYSGVVGFGINDPDAPSASVPLSGTAYAKCFTVTPEQLNFGTVGLSNGQYCSKGKRKFVGINGCAEPDHILAVEVYDRSGAFSFVSVPALPLAVPQGGESPPFAVGFAPGDAGNYEGYVDIYTDAQPDPFVVYLSGSAVEGMSGTDLPDAGQLVCD